MVNCGEASGSRQAAHSGGFFADTYKGRDVIAITSVRGRIENIVEVN
jgi:hypothetical protein